MRTIFNSWRLWLGATLLSGVVVAYVLPSDKCRPSCGALGPFQEAQGLSIASDGKCAHEFPGLACSRCNVVFKRDERGVQYGFNNAR